jgi:hypothetical protein
LFAIYERYASCSECSRVIVAFEDHESWLTDLIKTHNHVNSQSLFKKWTGSNVLIISAEELAGVALN